MSDATRKYPADLKAQAGDDSEMFRQLMHDYGYIVKPGHPDRSRRRELGIGRGWVLPSE